MKRKQAGLTQLPDQGNTDLFEHHLIPDKSCNETF